VVEEADGVHVERPVEVPRIWNEAPPKEELDVPDFLK
jgi:cell division protein FtsZ